MEDLRLPHRSDYDRDSGEKWDECVLCGSRLYRAIVHFKQGAVSPTVGETVTGASSADTGVIINVTKTSGTYAGGDATGVIEMSSPTGYDSIQLDIFTDEESLNGSTSGNAFCVAAYTGSVQVWGRLVPEKDLIEYHGKKYCRPHFLFTFRNDWTDEVRFDAKEGDRDE